MGARLGTYAAVGGLLLAALTFVATALVLPAGGSRTSLFWSFGAFGGLCALVLLVETGRWLERVGRTDRVASAVVATSSVPPSLREPVARAPSSPPAPPSSVADEVHEHGANALALWKTAHRLLTARNAAEARRVEAGLLESLRESCAQRAGVRRRASILHLTRGGAPTRAMRFHLGERPEHFPDVPAVFTEEDYLRHGAGLCWAAIHDCSAAHVGTLRAWVREYDDLHGPDTKLKPVLGDHRFESILIAPIWKRLADGTRSPLGVVCLDSTDKKFYAVRDQQLVVMTAEAVAIGWTKWPP